MVTLWCNNSIIMIHIHPDADIIDQINQLMLILSIKDVKIKVSKNSLKTSRIMYMGWQVLAVAHHPKILLFVLEL